MILLMYAKPREHHLSYPTESHPQSTDPSRAALPGCAVIQISKPPAKEESEVTGRLTPHEAD